MSIESIQSSVMSFTTSFAFEVIFLLFWTSLHPPSPFLLPLLLMNIGHLSIHSSIVIDVKWLWQSLLIIIHKIQCNSNQPSNCPLPNPHRWSLISGPMSCYLLTLSLPGLMAADRLWTLASDLTFCSSLLLSPRLFTYCVHWPLTTDWPTSPLH